MTSRDSSYDANGEDNISLEQKPNSHGWAHERSGTRDRGREREMDRDRHHRDQKDRTLRDEKGRDKYNNYDHHRSRNHFRPRDFDRDKEKKHGLGARTHSRDRFKNRARSRSPSPSHSPKSKRRSGFDMAPPVAAMPMGAAVPEGNVGSRVLLCYPLALLL